MANATQYPTLKTFQWSRPDAENPRLASPISSTDTTLTFTNPPLDETDAVVSVDFLMGIKNDQGYTETVYVPAGALSVDGLTATGVTRGIDLTGLDFDTGNPALAVDFDQDSPVYGNVSGVIHQMMISALQGTIASGGTQWQIGDETDVDITVFAANGDANLPYWRYDSAGNQWIFSNDGVSSTPFGTGAGVTGGDGITVTAGDIDIDLTDTVIFVSTSAGAGDTGKVARLDGSGLLDLTFLTANLNEANTFFGATDITGAEAETLSDGSDANGLHTHEAPENLKNVNRVYINIDGSTPNEVSTGTVTEYGGALRLNTGATSSSEAGIGADLNQASNAFSMDASSPRFFCGARFISVTNQDAIIGFCASNGTLPANHILTNDHAAFLIEDGTLYASTADGATQAFSDISAGVTLTDWHNYYIEEVSGNYAFYVDGVLKFTSSGNNPNSALYSAVANIGNSAAEVKTLTIGSPVLTFNV